MEVHVPDWKINVIVFVIGIIILFALSQFILPDKIADIQKLESAIAEEKTSLDKYNKILNNLSSEKIKSNQELIHSSKNELDKFLKKLSEFILKTNNKNIHIKLISSQKLADTIDSYNLGICIEGKYNHILGFLNILNSYEKLCEINALTMESIPDSSELRASIVLSYIPSLKKIAKAKKKEIFWKDKNPFEKLKPANLSKPYNPGKSSVEINLVYAGTIDLEKKFALIYEGSKGYIVKEGDFLPGKIQVVKIKPQEAILIRNNQKIVLRLVP